MGTVLVGKGDTIVFSRGYGMAHVEQALANSVTTSFRLGSLSKPFTALAILQLQEQDLLDVHDTLGTYLPDFPHAEDITIHHLLTHTSGIADYTRLPDYPSTMHMPTSLQALVQRLHDLPLMSPPGESFHYSNSNYVLLTAIIEHITGRTYDTYLQQNIFQPLGMDGSGYLTPPLAHPTATGYIFTGSNYPHASAIDASVMAGAGGLYSSADDLFRWFNALASLELVTMPTQQLMVTSHVPAGRTGSGNHAHYGYGWFISELHGQRLYSHAGGTNGYSSQFLWFPETQDIIVVLANIDAAPSREISQGIAAILFHKPYTSPTVREVAPIDPGLFERYAGRYALGNGTLVTLTSDGTHLYLDTGGRLQFTLFPASTTEFFLKNAEASLVFEVTDEGRAEGFFWHQNGHELWARRID